MSLLETVQKETYPVNVPFFLTPVARFLLGALVAIMGSASLAAQGGELDLVGLPAKARPGSVLTFRVETMDIPEGTPVEITYEIRATTTIGRGGTVPPSGVLTVNYRVPEGTPRTWLTIRARAGELASEPVAVAISDAAAAAGPAAPPTLPGASASPMDRLPDALKTHLATFLDTKGAETLGETSRSLLGPARAGIRTILIQGDLDRDQLVRYLAERSHVEAVTLGDTPKLTSMEILRALEALPRLKRLEVEAYSPLSVADAVTIARSHAARGFDELSLNSYQTVTPEQLAHFPETMRNLQVSGNRLKGPEFGRFRHLAHLVLRNCTSFTGEGLPPELASLELSYCTSFTTTSHLPARLQNLVLDELPEFQGPIHLAELRSLKVIYCPRFTRDHARLSVAGSRALKSLELEGLDRATLLAAPKGLEVLRDVQSPGDDITDEDLSGFTQLRVLELRGALCSGSTLPASLRELRLSGCDRFRTEHLAPIPLTHLVLISCNGATGNGLPGSLRVLRVTTCPAIPLKSVADALDHLGSLDILAYESKVDGAIGAAELEKIRLRAPSMTRCVIERDFGVYALNHQKQASAP